MNDIDYKEKYESLVKLINTAYCASPNVLSVEEIILLMNYDLGYLQGKLEILEKKGE